MLQREADRAGAAYLVDAGDGAIVDALIALGHSLRMEVVAEGVETKAQRDFLAALGCHVGQGFLFGRPVTAEEVERLLARREILAA